MFLYPPWSEKPGRVYYDDLPVSYGRGEVDTIPQSEVDPRSPIKKETEPTYSPLWERPTKQFSGNTTVGICWGRLLLQWVGVGFLVWLVCPARNQNPGTGSEGR
jgi:hypothetical protein